MAAASSGSHDDSVANKNATNDDLDDLLDDALKDFTEIEEKQKQEKNIQNDNLDGSFNALPGGLDDLQSEEMMKEFTKQFENAMGGLEIPGFDPAEFEKLLQSGFPPPTGNPDNSSDNIDANFAEAWNQFGKNFSDLGGAAPGDGDDIMEAMRHLGIGSEEGEPDEMMGLVQGMMQNLLSKDILYPSLVKLKEKYPLWLKDNKETCEKEAFSKHERQYKLCCEICEEFDQEEESDGKIKNNRFEKITELMFQMEKCGQPPEEIREQLGGQVGAGTEQGGEQCSIM